MRKVTRKNTLLLVVLLLFGKEGMSQELEQLIPKPIKAVKQASEFILNQETQLVTDSREVEKIVHYIQTEVLKHQGISLRTVSKPTGPYIKLQIISDPKWKDDAYQLLMDKDKIEIRAISERGLFSGAISLLQFIRQKQGTNKTISLQCWHIEDQPLYSWRGIMLDESRHFFGKQKVKQILDWMAFYKLNKFHWHLTDQPGWRIEIKSYPKLTLIGGVGNHTDSLAPAKYYTQEEIKEIVRYAAERYIDVIPEIDMPGHATAANKAYPSYSGGGSEKYPEFTFNPGKEETYRYLTDILREVDALFPSQMIHLGADEVHFGNQHWNKDSAVQQLMKTQKLGDLQAVEHYFVKRMADSLQMLNNEVLAWDEVVNSQLSPEKTTIFWWRHDKPEILKEALKKGFKVVLCPRLPLYFDFVQDSTHTVGRKWKGAYVSLNSVYDYSFVPENPVQNSQIRGIQANLWTEALISPQQIDFMLFPRIAALAEAAWTSKSAKSFEGFKARLKNHFKLYTADGLYFYNSFDNTTSPEWLMPGQRSRKIADNEALTKQETGKSQ